MTSGKKITSGAVALALSTFILVATGCVDEDPIITGKRPDAGPPPPAPVVDSGPPPITTIVPAADTPDEDAPDCRRCAETLSTDTARGTLCRKNDVGGSGLSSVRLLNQLVDCVCYDKCIEQCPSYCSGSKNTPECQLCLSGKCTDQLGACLGDVK